METPLLNREASPAPPLPAAAPGDSAALPSTDDLLRILVQREGSDLHLRAGEPPIIRVHGQLQRLDMPRLTPRELSGKFCL